ncbi:MAG: Fe-S cluster assembly protein HesB, partial [candidate division Zixibacteria bacterium]|nr:Fe-S cluster assembly protein HesB [candidate division Zixibacteria bacterium]
VPKYLAWIERWPAWQALALATNQQLLAAWSGLGYNRRALNLGRIAQAVVRDHGGELPTDQSTLLSLPGIGPYTSRAILIFAFNHRLVTVDTNIRRVILHEFDLPAETGARDIEYVAAQLLPARDARTWHYALMDYSSLVLPRRIPGVPPRTVQSPFEGSLRQIRGEIIRRLSRQRRVAISTIAKSTGRTESDVLAAAESLARENIVKLTRHMVRLVEDRGREEEPA